ncbi:MAG: PD-(D/E)XK nuclease family protein [Pseudomonadota bacterium]|nr:PD-(D/E)XK nuclease family protein [Pseudomonadota bacterium]
MPAPVSSNAAPAQAPGLDAALIAAIEAGRDLIVPDRHRAAALRLAWARGRQRQGSSVWTTPSVHTWEAWLTRQWREALQRGAVQPLQLLGASQERVLWEEVLAELAAGGGDEAAFTLHAGALMRAAAAATQAGIDPARSAGSREEQLLSAALAAVRRNCAARGLLSLRLADAQALAFLEGTAAPLLVGELRLTPLLETLRRKYWPREKLLLAATGTRPAPQRLVRAADLEQELAACAAWCHAHVQRDPAARLLVLSACTEPSLAIQGALLWRALACGNTDGRSLRETWLAVEGGEPLLHQPLVADALTALGLMDASEGIETSELLILLRSPHLHFGAAADVAALSAWIAATGLARFSAAGLGDALRQASHRCAAAAPLETWLAALWQLPADAARLPVTDWAMRFAAALDAAGFATHAQLDTRGQQRLARWHELLDEFAALDAVLAPVSAIQALRRLRQLASQSRHQPASADAAVTLSDHLADPVASYDGIWVLGLADGRWPAPPRPDPWIALGEQRRSHWAEAGVTQRREQAQWALACWRQRCGELVLSYPEREGDLTHRPAALPGASAQWAAATIAVMTPQVGLAARAADQQLAPLPEAMLAAAPLPGGAARLDTQQDCPFRAQARWRLGAEQPAALCDGVPASLRGRLLHALLNFLWGEVATQARLLSLDPAAERGLAEQGWNAAVQATREAAWLAPAVLAREKSRALAVTARVLALERQRAPFTVAQREQAVQWEGAGARLALRIDRVDQCGADALLIDYKTGAAGRVALHDGELQPLQLALYAAALAQQGQPVSAAALLTLHPSEPAFAGAAARGEAIPRGLRAIGEWQPATQQWQQQLQQLMAAHLSGDATLARDPRVCARCHLPALCRRAEPDAAEPEDE